LQSSFRKPDLLKTSGYLKPARVLTAKSVSQNIDSGMAFGKICMVNKCFYRSGAKSIFKYLRNYEVKKVKTKRSPEESIDLIFQNV
jgi:hypothetical protein